MAKNNKTGELIQLLVIFPLSFFCFMELKHKKSHFLFIVVTFFKYFINFAMNKLKTNNYEPSLVFLSSSGSRYNRWTNRRLLSQEMESKT